MASNSTCDKTSSSPPRVSAQPRLVTPPLLNTSDTGRLLQDTLKREFTERRLKQLHVNPQVVLENAQHLWSRTKVGSVDSMMAPSAGQPKIFVSKRTKNLVIKMPNGEVYEGKCSELTSLT